MTHRLLGLSAGALILGLTSVATAQAVEPTLPDGPRRLLQQYWANTPGPERGTDFWVLESDLRPQEGHPVAHVIIVKAYDAAGTPIDWAEFKTDFDCAPRLDRFIVGVSVSPEGRRVVEGDGEFSIVPDFVPKSPVMLRVCAIQEGRGEDLSNLQRADDRDAALAASRDLELKHRERLAAFAHHP
ncbi:MAG: hypothetical protein EON91_12095 [Brevundimonas sp.]|uniref:hypothetical protein n=1 Tax=Brevundimonas sp. TaxID=1871086 RepID=UPI0011F8C08D|nr:hypothetical protein [Brevundimonas sp.]RZJ16719.1 MAG: hypothetical protein EON91_12095 [Brevundimonas sp.]